MATYQDINSFDWSSIIPADQQQQQFQPIVKQEEMNDDSLGFSARFDQQQEYLESDNSTNATTSPLEFSSLFDNFQQDEREFDEESLFSNSNLTSLDNSPLIKPEDFNNSEVIPKLELQYPNENSLERNLSTSSSSSTISSQSTTEPSKPKKKRAPRKRLTPHQKQAHNKIEKRYRININAKIAGLQQIIPWVASEKTAFETGTDERPEEASSTVPKLNKSMILEKATAYILHLQENEANMKKEIEELKMQLANSNS
ncbi:hypothetical protein WICMUC_005237 [Wickerhamomyces mucosus]|uniref:BHLH domain-containing protein n=1 Tax=Wickerhamomyces mucosus TaxID=1378264 RepID=A0A9P8P9L8_9ASCO|nr:hypothetical protein WICMUC_005237 [Wickerhamomyces mucosus]